MNHSAILRFVAIAYSLSIALSLVIGITGGYESRLIGLGFLSMSIPAVAACVTQFTMNEPFRIDWHRFPLAQIPVALFLMPAVMHTAMLPVARAYEGRLPWLPWLTNAPHGIYQTSAPFVWGSLSRGALAEHVVANALFGLIVVSFLAFFEEIGWRAWLLPRMIERLGLRKGIIAVSILWAFWHTPYALSGIQHLDGVKPMIAALILPIGVAGSGLIIGWLWVRTRSIWIVSIAHGALNNWGQYAFKYMQFVRTPPAVISLVGSLAMLLIGSLLVTIALRAKSRGESHARAMM